MSYDSKWKAAMNPWSRENRRLRERVEAAENEAKFWEQRYKTQHGTLHSCEDVLAAERDKLERVRKWAETKIRKASGAKFQITAEGDAREVLAILDGEDE